MPKKTLTTLEDKLSAEEEKIASEIMSQSSNPPKPRFFAKEDSKDVYRVVSETGETIRVYKTGECEDPKVCAESYAKKLSN